MIVISLIEIGTNNYKYIGSKEIALSVLIIGYVVLLINSVLCGIFGSCCKMCYNRYDKIQNDENDIEKNVDAEEQTDDAEEDEVEIQVKQ
jgi:hypothetical protein